MRSGARPAGRQACALSPRATRSTRATSRRACECAQAARSRARAAPVETALCAEKGAGVITLEIYNRATPLLRQNYSQTRHTVPEIVNVNREISK